MTKSQFEGEFDQILRMLREHSFLLYAPSARAEYENKVKAAFVHFQNLLRDSVGMELPYNPSLAEDLARLRSPAIAGAARALSRTGARLAALGREDQAKPWIKAAAALRTLR